MTVPVRIAATAVAAVLIGAAPARAADYCVKPYASTGCFDTLAQALAAARADATADRILLGAGTLAPPSSAQGRWSDGGTEIAVVGAGARRTTLGASLRLGHAGSTVTGVRIDPAAGDEPALLLAGGAIRDSTVVGQIVATGPARVSGIRQTAGPDGGLLAEGGFLTVDDVDLVLPSGTASGLQVACGSRILARHMTVTGATTAPAGRTTCDTARLQLESSIVRGGFDPDAFAGPAGTIMTSHSAHADDPDAPATARIDGDPGLDAERRPAPGSPAIDAGDPQPLALGEPFTDLDGLARVADGDGDGTLRRDAGAHEVQPPAVPLPTGNVLANPGAEDGLAGWTGTFQTARYGAAPWTPTLAMGGALGAGATFFAGGDGTADPQLVQRIDVAGSGAAIDTGRATVTLSGLLGGYGGAEDGDTVTVSAVFRDPEGIALGPALVIGPVAPGERGNATNLLFRTAAAGIPKRTRAVDVVIAGHRTGGSYTDAYADNVALVPSVPGVPVEHPPGPGPVVPGLKPFSGITVLHPRAAVTRRGTTRIALACASATVGACAGSLDLRARLHRRAASTRIARIASFSVRPGRRRGVHMRLLAGARRALRGRRSVRATIIAVARDGQAVQRTRTVPVRLALPATRPAGRR